MSDAGPTPRAPAGSAARRLGRAGLLLLAAAALPLAAAAQERGPTEIAAGELQAAIDRLGNLDYDTRMTAARAVRRAPQAQAVPALIRAVHEHGDGYVRFKALVLLSGFNDPRIADTMEEVLSSPNDRLREVGFAYFEHHPDRRLIPRLIEALDREEGEFVRPAIIRALAAVGDDPRVRDVLLRDVMRGVDFFRSTVIEALGDYGHVYAVPALIEIARLEGPLQGDAAVALGKIGDPRALEVLAQLQRAAPREVQPAIASAICLLGVNCSSHVGYLRKLIVFADRTPGYQVLLRGAAAGLGRIAAAGHDEALQILLDIGIPSEDPVRAPIALALGLVALRNTPFMIAALQQYHDQRGAISLLAEGFDMLEEDYEEERFFVAVRRAYWAAPDDSPARPLAEQLITVLHF